MNTKPLFRASESIDEAVDHLLEVAGARQLDLSELDHNLDEIVEQIIGAKIAIREMSPELIDVGVSHGLRTPIARIPELQPAVDLLDEALQKANGAVRPAGLLKEPVHARRGVDSWSSLVSILDGTNNPAYEAAVAGTKFELPIRSAEIFADVFANAADDAEAARERVADAIWVIDSTSAA